jgi:hypothetical protein
MKSKGITAKGYEDTRGFVVIKGSQVVKEETPLILQYLTTLRKDLRDQKVIVEEGSHYVFTQDRVFNSPSMAAGVILGASVNGRATWVNSEGKTLRELQEAAVN